MLSTSPSHDMNLNLEEKEYLTPVNVLHSLSLPIL